jgi:hypothetical protein
MVETLKSDPEWLKEMVGTRLINDLKESPRLDLEEMLREASDALVASV